jgi:hypothetical protein
MFIKKLTLPRRTFLRGMGVTVALPLLEAMVPALKAAAGPTVSPRRFVGVYVPHGWILDKFIPLKEGTDYDVTPILKPLEPVRDQLLFVSGVNGPATVDGGGHALAPACWLTGSTAKKTQGADIHVGTSIDQIIAKKIGQDTVYPSLELATEDFSETVGSCEIGFSCAYMNTISWSSPTTPVPMELNPRVVFERLFGGTGTPEQRLANMRWNSSILDDIKGQAQDLKRELGPQDQTRVNEYLENIREIERRIQRAELQAKQRVDVPSAPSGIPESFAEHTSMQFELLALALQADITRVASFMNGRDVSYHNYPELGFTDGHHPLSHHANNPEKMAKFAAINTYEMSIFGKFLQKLHDIADGDGTLLDHSTVLYGSGMSVGNLHSHTGFPMLIAGGGGGTIHGGRHQKHPVSPENGLPNGNVLLSIVRSFGCEVDSIGQSNGTVEL